MDYPHGDGSHVIRGDFSFAPLTSTEADGLVLGLLVLLVSCPACITPHLQPSAVMDLSTFSSPVPARKVTVSQGLSSFFTKVASSLSPVVDHHHQPGYPGVYGRATSAWDWIG